MSSQSNITKQHSHLAVPTHLGRDIGYQVHLNYSYSKPLGGCVHGWSTEPIGRCLARVRRHSTRTWNYIMGQGKCDPNQVFYTCHSFECIKTFRWGSLVIGYDSSSSPQWSSKRTNPFWARFWLWFWAFLSAWINSEATGLIPQLLLKPFNTQSPSFPLKYFDCPLTFTAPVASLLLWHSNPLLSQWWLVFLSEHDSLEL